MFAAGYGVKVFMTAIICQIILYGLRSAAGERCPLAA